MKRLLAGLAALLLISAAHAEVITVTPSGGGGGGTFPPTGCVTANGVIFNNATPCDSGLTYAGGGGQLSLNGKALGATTGLLVNPASASGLLADFQVGGTSQWKVSSAGVVTQLGGQLFSPTNTIDIGTNATTLAPRTVYAGTSFVGPTGTFTASINLGAGPSILTSPAAATTQFGAADVNGAPVAQTISFQGALAASATNTASANTTIIGSLGTGTGTNGDIIFKTGVKTSTGTAQATPTTAMTIKGETQIVSITPSAGTSGQSITVNRGSVTTPAYGFNGADNIAGLFYGATNGVNAVHATINGDQWAALSNSAGTIQEGPINWATTSGQVFQTIDLSIKRDAANILAQVNGTNAQSFRAYNTSSSANANYERGVFGWTDTSNVLSIGTQANGTGTLRNISLIGGTVSIASTTDASASSGSGSLQVVGGGSVAKRFWLPAITTSSGLQTAVLCQSSGGEVIADSVACLASSERFKEHILPSDMGLEIVMALQPVTYDYRLTGNNRFDNAPNQRARQVGFLAEHAQHVDQRLVAVDSEGNVRTFRYEQYTAVMTKAMQELKAGNDNLRAEIEALRRSFVR